MPGAAPPNSGITVAVKVTGCATADGLCEEIKVVVVVACVTAWATMFDVLVPKLESPAYTALTLSVPPVSVEIVRVADPELKVPVPNTFVPCRNVTPSPSGGAPSVDVTTAVKLTACPKVDGLSEDESLVVVLVTVALRAEGVPSNKAKTIRMPVIFITGVNAVPCQVPFEVGLGSVSR